MATREQAMNQLCVSLDFKAEGRLQNSTELLKALSTTGIRPWYKFSRRLYEPNPSIWSDLQLQMAGNGNFFMDGKFHDITSDVAAMCYDATRPTIQMMNVMAQIGSKAMKKAAETVAARASELNIRRPKVIAVTLLTSVGGDTLCDELCVNIPPADYVLRMTDLAMSAGLDGVVCSAEETARVRQEFPDAFIVNPAIRLAGAATDDQSRVKTPFNAIVAGADLLVVGRPIIEAPDPIAAAEQFIDEIVAAQKRLFSKNICGND